MENVLMDVNEIQIGGGHYRGDYQHWDWVEDTGMGYLEGVGSKYICRWKSKNGIEDLRKSVHYVDKLLDLCIFKNRRNRAKVLSTGESAQLLRQLESTYKLNSIEFDICKIFMSWEHEDDLIDCKLLINKLINLEQQKEAKEEEDYIKPINRPDE